MTLATAVSALALLVSSDPPVLQQGGGMMQQDNGSTYAIDQAINRYLDVPEQKNIVTPGDYTEWPLQLKEGQVVIADARSDAFDPALEIANGANATQASNDDRYPGDQRPILLWRCPADGKFALRVRSFQNKSGGQAFIRFKVYDSIDIGEQPLDREFREGADFLFRIRMKKGEVRQLAFDFPNGSYARPALGQAISPIGLPNPRLARAIEYSLSDSIVAPVDGDYYVVAEMPGGCRMNARLRVMDPKLPKRAGKFELVAVPKETPVLVEFDVKAGQLIEISTKELGLSARGALAEVPDFGKFDLADPEKNPFFPQDKKPQTSDPFRQLPARGRDPRMAVYAIVRDAKLWFVSNGLGGQQYSVSIAGAAESFEAGVAKASKLRIGKTDYWAFDANVGDVMKFDFGASGFSQKVIIRDPSMREIFRADALPDQDSLDWQMVATEPGRYLVAISSIGDGGGGDYSLTRKVIPPREFGKGTPATGSFEDGQTQVWKCSIKPGEPIYVHWKSVGEYESSVRDANGNPIGLNLTAVDVANKFGIISVSEPTTLLFVLTPRANRGNFSITLTDLPGYRKG